MGFDRLLIATGVRARPWPNEAEAGLEGLFSLRTPDDADGLRQRLAAAPGRVLVIGGFIGCEVASACRELDVPVTGTSRRGCSATTGRPAVRRAGGSDGSGWLRRAWLSDGSTLDVDVAVAAPGSFRNVAFNQSKWLKFYEELINQAASFPPSFRTVDQPADGSPVAAEVPDRPTHHATVVVTGHGPGERRATLVRRTYL
ncbi:FAD-dependent oxidoreductase [Streptomyces sp. NPDC048473]|uniref:FAD-dependent oxidoreductase n=1 Tax=unclassified Streptomyces TaxID=2593676 RepID=UPI0037228AFB